jgi:hypothetical protein
MGTAGAGFAQSEGGRLSVGGNTDGRAKRPANLASNRGILVISTFQITQIMGLKKVLPMGRSASDRD